MRLYIAGPMRGVPGLNFPSFHELAALLRIDGHDVVDPAAMDEAAGIDPNLPETNEVAREALGRDVDALLTCEAVVLLPGWEFSRGARAEVALARAVDMPTFIYKRGCLWRTWKRVVEPKPTTL